jgi:hypothetical protein
MVTFCRKKTASPGDQVLQSRFFRGIEENSRCVLSGTHNHLVIQALFPPKRCGPILASFFLGFRRYNIFGVPSSFGVSVKSFKETSQYWYTGSSGQHSYRQGPSRCRQTPRWSCEGCCFQGLQTVSRKIQGNILLPVKSHPDTLFRQA